MTYQQFPPQGNVPPYEIAPRRSKAAIVALIFGILALIPLIGIPFGIVAIICGIVGLVHAGRSPYNVTGKGMAITGLVMGGISVLMSPVLLLMVAILLPSLGKARELANRSYCAANLHGLAQSMIVYSNENNDQFPLLPYAPYSASNAGGNGAPASTDADVVINRYYAGTSPQAGSVLAAQWILVLRSQCAPKQFLCKSDPNCSTFSQAKDSAGSFYTNFQSDNQFSYSFAYPYTADGRPGPWWKNSFDSSLPIMSDMAPMNGTGKPTRTVNPGSPPSSSKSWNSANHQGDGQNIAFADAHTEFDKRPDIGQSNDNIYTLTGRDDVSAFGGTQPVKSPINIETVKTAPFDIIMVPQRNLDTGGL